MNFFTVFPLSKCMFLWSWSFLLAFTGSKRHIGSFNNLHDYHLQHGLFNQIQQSELHCLLSEVQSTIIGHKHGGFLAILDELNTLPDRRLWLFGFILYFSKNNSLFMRRTAQELGLQGHTQVGFLVFFLSFHFWFRQYGDHDTSPSCQSHGPKCKKTNFLKPTQLIIMNYF